MKRQAAIIASTIFAFALVAVLISADKIPIGVVTVVNGTGGGNLTVSGTGGTDQLLTWDTDTTGHWTSGISSFGVTNLAVLSSMSINITNQLLATDGSGNVVGVDAVTTDGNIAVLQNGATISDVATQFGSLPALTTIGTVLNDTNYTGAGFVATQSGTIGGSGVQIILNPDAGTPPAITSGQVNGLAVYNDAPIHTADTNVDLSSASSTIGVLGNGGPQELSVQNGSGIGVYGYAQGSPKVNIGVAGWSQDAFDLQSLIGLAGSVTVQHSGSTYTGGYLETRSTSGNMKLESSVLILEAATTGAPLLIGRTNDGTHVFTVANDGSTFSASTNFANYVYVTNDCSALTFTDRSRSPSSLNDAYRIVKSHATKNGQVDHDKLDKLAQGKTKDTRDLGMVISAQEMVIQDLLARIEKLEKK